MLPLGTVTIVVFGFVACLIGESTKLAKWQQIVQMARKVPHAYNSCLVSRHRIIGGFARDLP